MCNWNLFSGRNTSFSGKNPGVPTLSAITVYNIRPAEITFTEQDTVPVLQFTTPKWLQWLGNKWFKLHLCQLRRDGKQISHSTKIWFYFPSSSFSLSVRTLIRCSMCTAHHPILSALFVTFLYSPCSTFYQKEKKTCACFSCFHMLVSKKKKIGCCNEVPLKGPR